MTTNIVNNIYGDNANVASTAHSPNSGAAFASGNAIINQHIGNIQQGNQELANAFKNVLEALKTDAALDPAKRAEAEQQLTFLAEQAAKSKQQRQPLAVIKSVLSGIAQVTTFSVNLSKAWETFGPVIAGYLAG
ncbi:Imidazolone-5-propionate hydrolase [Cystobacter fuscus DSM 2262]|uniref:Imidazolone-5-propionate hydrolase n=1 Tax=Cystobacter fuscus (strain ATCC 25194 / DSM 2262 / NBRC 100088 / M29) TaxID=1242864 RepID=S9P152_CYSF2|nr:Imidazolone-5-propionate hydrolase [Cystobacter fuscus DSM 2262]